jgi:perosamine synthetase
LNRKKKLNKIPSKGLVKAAEKYLNAFWIGAEEEKNVLEVIRSKRLGTKLGNKTKMFEKEVARYQGVKYAIATTSESTALSLCMAALVGPGDEVIVPAISSLATANCILYNNAIPIFADIDPKTFNMDPNNLVKNITERTKAIISVHMYGCPADIDPIIKIAKKYDLFVIEDCALAMGAEYMGKKVGTFGNIACFSFGTGKQLYIGEGGMITTNDEKIANEVGERNHHYGTPRGERLIGKAEILGYNYKPTELASAVGLAQMKKLDLLNSRRIKNAEYLTKGLKEIDGIELPYVPPNVKHVFNEYVIKVDEEKVGLTRDVFWKALIVEGIMADPLFDTPMYLEPSFSEQIGHGHGHHCPFECPLYKGKLDYHKGICPTAEDVLKKVVAISPHPGLTKTDLEEIISVIRNLLK